jgi:hypothetical protein
MCRPASFVQLEKGSKVLWSKTTDSHSAILAEHGIRDDGNIAKLEVVPPSGDYSFPLDKWEFHLDGPMPAWFDAATCEKACRDALPTWMLYRTITTDCDIKEGVWFVKDGSPVITQSGGVVLTYGTSKPVITQSGGDVWTCGNSKPVITQSGGVVLTCGNSKPVITQSGGEVRTYGTSKPVITQSGGEVLTYGTSKPVIKKAKNR